MKPLSTKFKLDGFDFEQIQRHGRVAIFRKSKPNHQQATFEVVFIQERPAHTWPNGQTTEAHESMPGSEQWGMAGWSCYTLEAARARLHRLTGYSTPLYTTPPCNLSDPPSPMTADKE